MYNHPLVTIGLQIGEGQQGGQGVPMGGAPATRGRPEVSFNSSSRMQNGQTPLLMAAEDVKTPAYCAMSVAVLALNIESIPNTHGIIVKPAEKLLAQQGVSSGYAVISGLDGLLLTNFSGKEQLVRKGTTLAQVGRIEELKEHLRLDTEKKGVREEDKTDLDFASKSILTKTSCISYS